MNIKYYGIEGAEIDERFKNLEYWIDQVIKSKGYIYGNLRHPNTPQGIYGYNEWIDRSFVTAYEHGIAVYIKNDYFVSGAPDPKDASENPNERPTSTHAELIISDDEISFIIVGTANDKEVKDKRYANIELAESLRQQLGNKYVYDTPKTKEQFSQLVKLKDKKEYYDKIGYPSIVEKFSLPFSIYQLEKQYMSEKNQLIKEVEAIENKYLEKLAMVRETGNIKSEEKQPIDIIAYVKAGIENGTLAFEEAKKFQRIIARQGQVGEKIQTILADGTVETEPREVKLDENTGQPGWVVKNVNGPEQWIIEDSVFKKKYEIDPENPEIFKPKGGPMLAAQVSEPLTFHPPMWSDGQIQNINAGAYILVDPTDNRDIYGIGEEEFHNTYQFVNQQSNVRQ